MTQPEKEQAGATLADMEAALHKGRSNSLFVIAAFGVVLAGALFVLVGGDDQARVYGEIGKRINGIKRAQFDRFWECALPGENLADLRSNADLTAQLDGRGHERGRAYGVHLREQCLPKLEPVAPELDALIVPSDLQPQVAALSEATGQLRGAVSEYVAYLDDKALSYDPEVARPIIGRIARGWYDFKKAHTAFNGQLKSKLK